MCWTRQHTILVENEFYGDDVEAVTTAEGAASGQAGRAHRHSQVEPENSRWRKWSWESESVYGGEEIIPAVFTDVRQTFTQKYIQPTTEGAGWGGRGTAGKHLESVHVNKCCGFMLRQKDTKTPETA